MSKELEAYYNKFCEEKRLTRRHGNVEFITSMRYIHKYLKELSGIRCEANLSLFDKDKKIVRELARQYMEIATSRIVGRTLHKARLSA